MSHHSAHRSAQHLRPGRLRRGRSERTGLDDVHATFACTRGHRSKESKTDANWVPVDGDSAIPISGLAISCRDAIRASVLRRAALPPSASLAVTERRALTNAQRAAEPSTGNIGASDSSRHSLGSVARGIVGTRSASGLNGLGTFSAMRFRTALHPALGHVRWSPTPGSASFHDHSARRVETAELHTERGIGREVPQSAASHAGNSKVVCTVEGH